MTSKKSSAARKAQREYMREWRKKNPEKVREANRLYWQRRAERLSKGREDKNER